jgi:quinol---cytochrome c reductase iron-sulfur subunit, bacillus type
MISPNQPSPGCCCCGTTPPVEPRRGFLALCIAAAAYAVPFAAGVVAFLNPLRQKAQAGEFLRLTSLDTLPQDGAPIKMPVVMDRVDAWNRFPNEPVGAVFLRRTGQNEILAFQVVCPHAGCFVDYDASNKRFFCPCHKAAFDLEGKRLDARSESPRDLDKLEVKIEKGTEVWVQFQKFQPGTTDKLPEA